MRLRHAVAQVPELASAVPMYDEYLRAVRRLRDSEALSQAECNDLSRAVPVLFWPNKEWTPPLVRAEDGRFAVPTWFDAVDAEHERVQRLAFALRVLGSY